jgi:predicted DNA-binding antitoxin AbrB/MazE fold protein
MLAIKALVEDGLIKPLEDVDLPEDKEVVFYIPDEKVEEYTDGTDEEWQRFRLHSFMNTEDDKDVDWEDFFNYNLDDVIKEKIAWAVTSANAVSEWKNLEEEEEVWK